MSLTFKLIKKRFILFICLLLAACQQEVLHLGVKESPQPQKGENIQQERLQPEQSLPAEESEETQMAVVEEEEALPPSESSENKQIAGVMEQPTPLPLEQEEQITLPESSKKDQPVTVEEEARALPETSPKIEQVISTRERPLLSLNTEMHTAAIKKMDVDAAERYLVTASQDKTVRVWYLQEDRLLRVLHLPIDKNGDGQIDAVAISPDGQTVAMGGMTDYRGNQAFSIYLFNRATGELQQRLSEHPALINHLAYSLDGQYLVASLKEEGIRIYHTSDYHLQAKDSDYGGSSDWAEFDRTSRLVTTCVDGYIRLYNEQFELLSKRKAIEDDELFPFSARFSPKGDKIAVGFADFNQIQVLSGANLKPLYVADTEDVIISLRGLIAWSKEGRWLYSEGAYDDGSNLNYILRWSKGGKGSYRTWPASSEMIMALHSLQDGSFVFGTTEPAFGRFNRKGEKTLYRKVAIVDFRSNPMGLLLSYEGDRIQFEYQYENQRKQSARFSLNERLLTLNPSESEELIAPLTDSDFIKITDLNTFYPKLNGQPLTLDQQETAHSVAIADDEQHFLLGTESYLRFFNEKGQQQWQVPTPGKTWGVNIAGNSEMALAAFSDGTLRWYRLTDGTELLAFFPHLDGKRWILWTPQGYYAASAGAEDLLGWSLNNGPDKMTDFFPVARFRDSYYRPDVVTKVLNTLDPEKALLLANVEAERGQDQQKTFQERLPPIVTLLSPQDGTTFSGPEIELRYHIRSPSNEAYTSLKVLLDGRPLKIQDLGLQEEEIEQNLQLTLPPRNVEVSLIVENHYAASEPATVQLHWQGPQETAQSIPKPNLYVLAVGVSHYEDSTLKLNYAAQDVIDLEKVLKIQKQKALYREVKIKRLDNASKNDIFDGLDWLEHETTQNDVVMIFLAGHGINDDKGRYYFLPCDVNLQRFKSTTVPYHYLQEIVSSLPSKILFFLDTIYSAQVIGANYGMADVVKITNDLASIENGIVVFASSTGKQFSLENPNWQNGAFMEVLIEALNGFADSNKDNRISIHELDLYLSQRVKTLTNGSQTPIMIKPKTIQDFPVFAYETLKKVQQQKQTVQVQEPPIITLLSPQGGTTFSDSEIALRYRLSRSSNEPITDLKVLVDGVPLKQDYLEQVRALNIGEENEQTVSITLPKRDVKISLIAANQYTQSSPASVQLHWQKQQPSFSEFKHKPKLYLLAVGVGEYKSGSVPKLNYAAQDARDFVQVWKTQKKQKGLYRDVSVKLLTDASKGEILDGLDWLERQTTQHDVAVTFFAGHGVNDYKGRYYYLPNNVNVQRLKRTAIAYHDIKETVGSLPGKSLFFIDTCHSGNIMGTRRGIADIDKLAKELMTAESSIVVFTSSTGKQYSLENAVWKNGAFTEALVDALNGQADLNKDSAISIKELDFYLSDRVKTLTKGRQSPTTTMPETTRDFPIATTP